MNSAAALSPDMKERQLYAAERARIDASARLPVLVLFSAAVFWLLVGTVFAMLASIKLHTPGFLGDIEWLTFGRVRSAHLDTVAFGWVSNAAFGVLIWLMARLSWAEIRFPIVPALGGIVWNLGTLIGTVAVLAGQASGHEWLEFPIYVPPILVVGYVLIALSAFLVFRDRREKHVYVSQWYILGALFWLAWLYLTAYTLLFLFPVTGVVQATVLWWFGHNTIGLFWSSIAIASTYYLIPKVIGRPVHSYYLSIIGFWSLALFYNWAGTHHLIGGPIPAWFVTVGVIGSVMMFIPVGTTALNHHLTMVGHFHKLKYSPTLRFIVFGAMSYTVSSFQGSLESLRSVNEVTHFTHFTVAHAHLGMYAFFTMVMFGSMYYIVPRLTGWEWMSARLIRVHFWSCAIGILLYFAVLTWGGWFQGVMLAWPGSDGKPVPFMDIVNYTKPFLVGRSVGGTLLTIGHIAFAILFTANLLHYGPKRQGPTLFHKQRTEPSVTEAPVLAAAQS